MHRLGLAENDVGSPRIQSLLRIHELLRIPVLDLSQNGIGPLGLLAILNKPPANGVRLRELDLSHNEELSDAGARILAQSPQMANLRVLHLTNCAIGDDGARALAESQHLHRLAYLNLDNNPIGDAGFREYLSPSNLRGLGRLVYPALGLSTIIRYDLDQRFHRRRS